MRRHTWEYIGISSSKRRMQFSLNNSPLEKTFRRNSSENLLIYGSDCLRMNSSMLVVDTNESDHNRLVNHSQQPQPQQQQQQPQQNNSSQTGINTGIKGIFQSTNIKGPSSPLAVCETIKTTTKNSLEHSPSSPILGNNNIIAQSPSILQESHKKHLYQQQQQQQQQEEKSKYGGALDFQLLHGNKGVEALGVLLQYLAFDLDAFACPGLKNDYNKAQKSLLDTRVLLEETKSTCHDLQDQLQDKEAYYLARESELQALHRCELQKVESSLSELEISAKERIAALEAELDSKDAANHRKLQDYIQDTEKKFIEQDNEIKAVKEREQELLKRLSVLSTTENELREKVLASENSFAERLHAASQRERDLTEKINALIKQLDLLRHETESRERQLEEKLNLSHDEISILRSSRNSLDQAISPKNGPINKLQMLQDEVESLRCVLELKQSEISDLRKQNQELQNAADELPAAQMRISALESRVEDLQIQLKGKCEEEKELYQRNKHLQESYAQELKYRNRLSLHNEELQWRLKQNSEKFALALTELSKSYQEQQTGYLSVSSKGNFHNHSHESQDCSQNSSLNSLSRSMNGSDRMVGCFQMDDMSPPTSPIIKGVVEKNDSVSWVLEMDDESPEVLASRMVRRAGSFRSSFSEKSPGAKRQYSLPIGNNEMNPLSQSASATSVLRQHSNETADLQQMEMSQPNARTRSKSVTIKGSEQKRLIRQNSASNSSTARKAELSTSWKEPVCSSSPYARRSSRSSPRESESLSPPASGSQRSKCFGTENESVIYRKPQKNLITCDTSALTSSDRLEMRSIPSSHPSVQDFKNLKKCQEIQESAGEAMVSGTNSEDEGCSASSDETISSTSSTSLSRNLAIEHALLMEKINTSLGGTPMEVSWSDDADQFPSESVV